MVLSGPPNHVEKRLAINLSASMPRGIYQLHPTHGFGTGDLVVVRLPPTAQQFAVAHGILVPGGTILKRVAAASEDRVCRFQQSVSINGRLAAVARTRDRDANALPQWNGCIRLRPLELFVLGQATGSFDSRYFGVVDRSAVIGTARPLWTFSK